MAHILILGGDGYLGWPTAMYFSQRGYDVTVVDNYFRRNACTELDVRMLYSLPTLQERASIWHEKTGKEIKVVIGDLTNPHQMRAFFDGSVSYQWAVNNKFTGIPDTVVHYAEQPSAPYSLINYNYANTTISNNLLVTNNLMFAVRDYSPSTHIIKLGTMGEYGTPNIDIEEGWLEIEHKGRKDKFLFPRQASSIYHTTKIMDTDLLWFGVRMWNLRVTDLMQGPVYGLETEESVIDDRLKTLFNYDEVFGTVVNRFITQAVVGYPLTVYGKGGQIRGYLNIKDTLQCVHKSEITLAKSGELRIFNQIMETFSVNQLAELTKKVGTKLGYDVEIKSIENPRKESEEHYYNPTYQGLVNIGVEPHYLTEEVMEDMFRVVERYKDNIRKDVIFRGIRW
ncbi:MULTISPECIES: NAD-dependent epimerase/dehydratase family protein [Okeania]|uniref:NAD-dependent epimerase/dehydratase family protein n=1 Tax=Okeania TaxID=1458928 RepID=UPI000F532766|nr:MULTISPECIES: NAD-dependent epimerase/dehydratase family protein [Okeania]NET12047.1 NAD-dependent epimerase/dehydratase family protein [Okeania sp. SIO1H6]NEP91297.1 NAD-dependent epimerase/dehydratase family protein [Okeania sp. SIO2C2]NES77030.1 NAD-dependent epimerase/dehydratase family protein [Okeania sp. SIO1H4]NET18525.1 NAD-dependent epimerase/dehydratase family protein [Okeania sp. SIO1H5]NET94868.1 NAD-dependent epimerase/dehydratase family protein [Okeania sp. SIO1H2]